MTNEVPENDDVLYLLAYSLPATSPSARVRERLLSRVQEEEGQEISRRWSPAPGLWLHQSPDKGRWKKMDIPGMWIRLLNIDKEQRRATTLVRMDAGATYPSHRHQTAEESFVLEGDVHVAGGVLRKGDYQRAEAGSMHEAQFTEGGCTMLIISSLEDKVINAG